MRLREIIRWVRKYGVNPVEPPQRGAIPKPNDDQYDAKMRAYQRQVVEWEAGEKALTATANSE